MREIQPDKTAVDWPEFGSDFGVIIVKNGHEKMTAAAYARVFREVARRTVEYFDDYQEDGEALEPEILLEAIFCYEHPFDATKLSTYVERDLKLEELEGMSNAQLLEVAKNVGLTGVSKYNKGELIDAIQSAG
jgi:hypothetical protein